MIHDIPRTMDYNPCPHEPSLQASSSPLPRIKRWPVCRLGSGAYQFLLTIARFEIPQTANVLFKSFHELIIHSFLRLRQHVPGYF